MLRFVCVSAWFYLAVTPVATAQKRDASFDHVEPPFWWTGMMNQTLQILFHSKSADLQSYTVSLNYEGVTLTEVKKVENPHYLFLTLEVSSSAKAGKIAIEFKAGKRSMSYPYELKTKSN